MEISLSLQLGGRTIPIYQPGGQERAGVVGKKESYSQVLSHHPGSKKAILQPAVVQSGGSLFQGSSQGKVFNPDNEGEVLARRWLWEMEEEVTRPVGGQNRANEPANIEPE